MSRDRVRSTGTVVLVVLAALLALFAWRRPRVPPDGDRADDVSHGERDGDRGAEPESTSTTPSVGATTEEAEIATPPSTGDRPRTPFASAQLSGEVDPCAEPVRIERHDRLDELVNVRLAELRDRARLVIDDEGTSAGLRDALTAVLVRGETSLAAVEPAVGAPDRVSDGFDLAANLFLTVAVRFDRSDTRSADLALERAIRVAPRDAVPHVLRAIRRSRAHDVAGFREAIDAAFERDREEPAIALELAYALSRTTELPRALDALDAYLTTYPGDPEAAHLRARLARRAEGVGPRARSRTTRGVTVLFPADLAEADAIAALDIVVESLGDAARLLAVPRREELAVLVHRDHESMLRAMCGQSWTAAAYDGVLHVDRSLFDTHETSPTMRRGVLRHETLHAALHDRPRDVPYWMDEGIAQHFAALEDPSTATDLARLVRDHTYVPLASLDGAFLDIDDPADARLAYHQSLAMIEWLVAQRGEAGIAELVAAMDALPSGAVRDPGTILGDVARRGFDGDVLLAFLATR